MIKRTKYLDEIKKSFKVNNIVALLGPRQCGKTTLATAFIDSEYPFQFSNNYFDLESSHDLARLADAETTLSELKGLIVIDEIQRRLDLFPTLRYLHDKFPDKKFLILGSASRDLIRQSSESLAGRISYIEVAPFNYNEVDDVSSLWTKGGFPKSYLPDDEDSIRWRRDYVRTYLEHDLPTLGFQIPAAKIERFWRMLAHYHGQVFSGSAIGNSIDISHTTVKRYLDILASTFMVRILLPWHENIAKRQVKSPKIYIRDSGLLHYLFNINNKNELMVHPVLGASWEGFALEQILQQATEFNRQAYFWQTHQKAELDLLLVRGLEKIGIELKHGDAPKITKSMRIAMEDLKLNELIIVYPGNISYKLEDKIKVMTLQDALEYI